MIKNNKYEIQTPSGFQHFEGIRKLEKSEHVKLTLSDGTVLKCSLTHPFISNGKEIKCSELSIGTILDSRQLNKYTTVKCIEKINDSILLYDIVEVTGGNIFYVDGIVSHNCDFTTTGHTVLETDTLKWIKENRIKDPIEKRFANQSLWIWEYPDYTKNYLICADVARGDGDDYSAFHVLEMESLTQVAEFKGAVDTKTYGNLLVSMAVEYNKAILVVENNNIGWATLQQVIDSQYPNTFYSSADLHYVDLEKQLTNKHHRIERNMVPGFTTTTKTRPLIISKLEDYFRERSVITNSIRLYEELSVFIWNNGKAQAMTGYNDDLVTSLGMGLWVRDTALRLKSESGEYVKSLIGGISKTGDTEVIYTSQTKKSHDYWSMPSSAGSSLTNPNREREDLKWLL